MLLWQAAPDRVPVERTVLINVLEHMQAPKPGEINASSPSVLIMEIDSHILLVMLAATGLFQMKPETVM